MALVVVRHGAATPLLHRQARLGAVQRLHLALLVHAEHESLLRRSQIEPDPSGELFQQSWIARPLEALDPVRLEIVAAPEVADRRLAHLLAFRHQSATPLGHALGLGL